MWAAVQTAESLFSFEHSVPSQLSTESPSRHTSGTKDRKGLPFRLALPAEHQPPSVSARPALTEPALIRLPSARPASLRPVTARARIDSSRAAPVPPGCIDFSRIRSSRPFERSAPSMFWSPSRRRRAPGPLPTRLLSSAPRATPCWSVPLNIAQLVPL
jgi:hypothetical protein